MNSTRNNSRYLVIVGVFIILIGLAVVFYPKQPRRPKVLNQQTPQREVRPFSTKPDPRFDPLPFEREKHGK